MNKLTPLLACYALAVSSFALAECNPPSVPALADGATADMSAMAKSQQDVKSFQADAAAFYQCINQEGEKDAEDGEVLDEANVARDDAYNSVLAEETALAESWNTEIGKYKSRQVK